MSPEETALTRLVSNHEIMIKLLFVYLEREAQRHNPANIEALAGGLSEFMQAPHHLAKIRGYFANVVPGG